MSRSTGAVIERTTARGITYALRFSAYGQRRYLTLGTDAEGWTRARADRELAYVLEQVQRGEWTEPTGPALAPVIEQDPGFHQFASAWFEAKAPELRPSTRTDYRWRLVDHLLPFFAGHTLAQITVAEVDAYREQKVREGKLSARSVNMTLTLLGQILDVAEERDLIARNPLRVNPRRRKVKQSKARPVFLDTAEQIVALLAAAEALDAGVYARGSRRYPLVATLLFAGLRSTEACELVWGDVNLAAGRITVGKAKTDAGLREVELLPVLRDVLLAYKAGAGRVALSDPVFPTAAGTARDRQNLSSRVVMPCVRRANADLEAAGESPLPAGMSPHKLRHTFASLLVALGRDPVHVMHQLGHTDPAFTLSRYAHLMRRGDDERQALRDLVNGVQLAPTGTGTAETGSRRVELLAP